MDTSIWFLPKEKKNEINFEEYPSEGKKYSKEVPEKKEKQVLYDFKPAREEARNEKCDTSIQLTVQTISLQEVWIKVLPIKTYLPIITWFLWKYLKSSRWRKKIEEKQIEKTRIQTRKTGRRDISFEERTWVRQMVTLLMYPSPAKKERRRWRNCHNPQLTTE